MRKICYSVAMSLDGYIAGHNGEYDWIVMDPEIDFAALMGRFDTAIMGRKSFEMTRAMHGGGTMPGLKGIVVSSTLKPSDYPEGTVLNKDLAAELTKLRKQPGKDIWLFGGGSLFRSLLEIGQVQTVEVAVIPVLLGDGIPLLPAPALRQQLKLIDCKHYKKTGTLALNYEVIKTKPK